MSRFFVDEKNIGEEYISIKSKTDIHHISKVLRLKDGDFLDISDSKEWEYKGEITEIDKDEVRLKILDKQKFAREPRIKITLFQGIPKQDKMELIIKMSVELGVFEIVPVFTKRTVVTDNGNMDKKIERWQKISDEAVKQCKRGIIPQVKKSLTFGEMVEKLDEYQLVLFPYENEEKSSIKDILSNLPDKPEKICIIIGPEGGFSDKEASVLSNKKAESVSLGKTILRTETAGITAIAMTMYELEL